MPPSLYGITHSNRNFSDPHYWGKNQFNSSFPAALACYMRDKGIPAVYIELDEDCKTQVVERDFDFIFGTTLPNDQLSFAFESIYEPFRNFVEDQLVSIDLVLKDTNGNYIRPFEIKLTTLPDNSTCMLAESQYGCELVLRSATLKYMALSIAESCNNEADKARIRELFAFCGPIQDWRNEVEAARYLPQIVEALETFFSEFSSRQKPILLQPIWKTHGKAPLLADSCLDIFVWSDFALSRLFMSSARDFRVETISRFKRAALRLARFLYDSSRLGKVYLAPIYDGMTYGPQTDKEFALSGNKTNLIMRNPRLTNLAIGKDEIKNIILGGGQKYLSPERRFDAIIYFATDLFSD